MNQSAFSRRRFTAQQLEPCWQRPARCGPLDDHDASRGRETVKTWRCGWRNPTNCKLAINRARFASRRWQSAEQQKFSANTT